MVIINGYTTTPHHRQNRRRERPGSRTRRSITRKSNLQSEYSEGLLDAKDISVLLPSDKSHPSPLFRQNFDQSWQRWKSRQAEEKAALEEMDKLQQEQEQLRLFGGDIDDDELYRMGILYNEDGSRPRDLESNTISCAPPVEQAAPLYVLRRGKPRRSRRRSTWRNIPLYLSFSTLRDDIDIARLLSPPISDTPTIQHHDIIFPEQPLERYPLSLPTSAALESSAHGSTTPITTHDNSSLTPTSQFSLATDFHAAVGDWTFIDTPHRTTHISSPSSEPETWILLSDDS